MAKKASNKHQRAAAVAARIKAAAAASTVQPVQQPVANAVGAAFAPISASYMLPVSGKPGATSVKEDMTKVTPVTVEDVVNFGLYGNRVTQGLAKALLGNVPLPHGLKDRKAECWKGRAQAQTKSQFFKVLEANVTVAFIRQAYEESILKAKRYSQPTIGALWQAVRTKIALDKGERKLSPMETWARSLLEVIFNRTLTTEEQVRVLQKMITEKAGYDDVAGDVRPQQQAAA